MLEFVINHSRTYPRKKKIISTRTYLSDNKLEPDPEI